LPGVVTVKFGLVPTTALPLDHEYVPPPDAVNEIDVVMQVNTVFVGGAIAADGATEFCVIT
jgi:hypothetical protein